MSFQDFFQRIPDVAQMTFVGNIIYLQRVSSKASSHMDNLTINKYSKNYKGPKFVTKSGALKVARTSNNNSLNAFAMPYQVSHRTAAPRYNPHFNPFLKINYNPTSNTPWKITSSSRSYVGKKMQPGVVRQTQQLSYRPSPLQHRLTFSQPQVPLSQSLQQQPQIVESQVSSPPKPVRNQPKIPVEDTVKYQQRSSEVVLTSRTPVERKNLPDVAKTETKIVSEPVTPKRPHFMFPTASSSKKLVTSTPKKVKDVSKTTEEVPKKLEFENKPGAKSLQYIRLNQLTQSFPTVVNTLTSFSEPNPINKTVPDNICEKMGKLHLSEYKQKATQLIEEKSAKAIKQKPFVEETELVNVENNKNFSVNPERERLRSMRLFRDALKALNENEQKNRKPQHLPEFSRLIMRLPEIIQCENETFFEIKMVDVISPSQFTFQFSLERLQELTANMDQFYNSLDDLKIYRIDEVIKENIVVYRKGRNFFRGQIKNITATYVEVKSIDYLQNANEKVLLNDLFYLHKKFTTESPKSAMGKLHGIKPKTAKGWDILCASKVNESSSVPLLATVNDVEGDVYSLSIYPKQNSIVGIADKLIELNLAALDLKEIESATVLRSLVSLLKGDFICLTNCIIPSLSGLMNFYWVWSEIK